MNLTRQVSEATAATATIPTRTSAKTPVKYTHFYTTEWQTINQHPVNCLPATAFNSLNYSYCY